MCQNCKILETALVLAVTSGLSTERHPDWEAFSRSQKKIAIVEGKARQIYLAEKMTRLTNRLGDK